MENVLVSTLPCGVCFHCQVHSPKPEGLPLKSGYMPTTVHLLSLILYNNNMALGLSYLSLLIQKSGCFKPQRRMLLDMSALNQNNKRLSRLAIISEHVAADKRKQFGTVWVDFCQGEFSFSVPGSFFSGTCLFLLNATLFAHCVSFSFGAVYSKSQ